MRIFTQIIFTLLVIISASLSLDAQITSSSITGRITDSDGGDLPGATVLAVHTPSGSTYGTVTNENGYYTIRGMRVGGPYKITATFIGFDDNVREGVNLNLGSQAKINFILSDGAVDLEELVVTASKNAEFGDEKTGASVNVTSEQIAGLPTINRSINDYTRLTPQSNGTSFAGTSSRFNNYTVDGNIYNNNFGLGSGQFAGGNPISIDAIEAVSVNLAPYDVRYSGFTGAAVNAVTKSGTNTFKGSAYYLLRNDQMQGTRAGDLSVDAGLSKNEIFGATIGGPIIKDKLFFFASYEQEIEAVPSFLKRAAREGETPDGLIISRVPLSEANFVRESLLDIYGYDTGAPDSYQFASEQERINFRLDFNISKKHKLSARFNDYTSFSDVPTNNNSVRFIDTRFRNTTRQGVENINFRNNNYTNDRRVTSYVAELNSIFSDNLSNQFNIGFTKVADPKRGIPGDQAFPMIEVLENDASGTPLYYMTMGNELFTVGNKLENNVFNITNNLTLYKDKHTFTAGVNFEYMTFVNAFNPVFNGFYRYGSYADFVEGVINQNPNVHPIAYARSFALDGTNDLPEDETNFGQLGLYIQDEYQASDRLKLTAGLRVDMPFYPIDIPANPLLDALGKEFTNADGDVFTPDVSQFPSVNPLFSPRVGFNYDLNGDRSTVIRGGTGIFSGRIPFVWLSNQINGSGVIRGGLGFEGQEVIDNNIIFNPDVTAYAPENPEIALSNELNVTDPNFKLPQVWRTNIGVDQKLPFGINGTLEFIFNRDVQTPIAYNPVLRAPDETLNGPDQRGYWTSAYSEDEDFRNVFLLTNADRKADYYGITASVSKQFTNGFYGMVAYTRSRARDLDAAGGSQAASLWPAVVQEDRNDPELGFAGFDAPNRVVGNLSYQVGGTSLGLFYDGGNAFRYSYTYAGNFGDNSDRLMYVPNDANELNFAPVTIDDVVFSEQEQRDLFDAYIDQDDYLSEQRGKVTERNGAIAPWVNRFDFRISQDINFTKTDRNKLQLTVDILNIGNLFDSNWGVAQVPWQSNPLSLSEINDAGEPVYRFNTIRGTSDFPTTTYRSTTDVLGSAWRMQVGVKYIF
jgi:hypothetical protein